MNGNPPVNKDLKNQTLQEPAGEGTSLLEECSAQKYFKKKKLHKVLPPEQHAKRATFKKAQTWLCKTFPDCFNLSTPKPLKRQIVPDIFSHLPEDQLISKRSIRTVLNFYVNRKEYHESLLENDHRFNLAGAPVEEIELVHKEHAKAALERKTQMKAVRVRQKKKRNIKLPRN